MSSSASENQAPVTPQGSKSRFLSDVAIYGFAGILSQALSFFLVPLFTHYLEPADYGILELINQIGRVVNLVFMLNGIRMATMTFFLQAGSGEEQDRVVSSLLIITVSAVAAGTLLVFPLAPTLIQVFKLEYSAWILRLGCVTILAEILPTVPYTLMQARVESRRFLFWNVGSTLIRLLATIFVVVYLGAGVYGILAIRAMTGLTAGLILLTREQRGHWSTPTRAGLSRIVKYSLPMVPVGIFSLIRDGSQRFFLLAVSGPAELGLYSLGATITSAIGLVVVTPIHKVWTANMYEVHELPDASRRLGAVATQLMVVYLLAGVPLILFGQEFLALISSQSYAGAWVVVIPLLMVGVIDVFTNIPDQVFLVRHKTHVKAYIDGVVAALTIGVYFLVIKRYGIVGAAYGLVLSALMRSILTVIVSRKVTRIQYQVGSILRLALMTGAICFIGLRPWDSLFLALAIKALLFLLWVALVPLLGIVPRETLVEFLSPILSYFKGLRPRKSNPPHLD